MLLKCINVLPHCLSESSSPRPDIHANLRSLDKWRPRMQCHLINIPPCINIPPKNRPPDLGLNFHRLDLFSPLINTIQRLTPLPLQRSIDSREIGAPARAIRLQIDKETRLSIPRRVQSEPARSFVQPVVMWIEAPARFVLDGLEVLNVFDGDVTLEMRRTFFDTFNDGVGIICCGVVGEVVVCCLGIPVGFINHLGCIVRNHSRVGKVGRSNRQHVTDRGAFLRNVDEKLSFGGGEKVLYYHDVGGS